MADGSEFLDELIGFLEPFANAARADQGVARLLSTLGWQTQVIPGFPTDAIQNILLVFADIHDALSTQIVPQTLDQFETKLKTVADAVDALRTLDQLFQGVSVPGIETTFTDLLACRAADIIRQTHPTFYSICVLLTIIEEVSIDPQFVGNDNVRVAVVIPMLRLERLINLLPDPVGHLKAEYLLTGGLTNPDATADQLFPRVAAVLRSLGVSSLYGLGPTHPRDYGDAGNHIADHTLVFRAPLVVAADAEGEVGAGAFLDSDVGLVVTPFGRTTFVEAGPSWTTTITTQLTADGFAIGANGLILPDLGGSVEIDLDVKRQPQAALPPGQSAEPQVVAGASSGARLELGLVDIGGHVHLQDTSRDFGFSFAVDKAALVIDSGQDGFLAELLPTSVRAPFNFGLAWSNAAGLTFKGSASLEVALPVTIGSPGTIEVSGIRLRLSASANAVTVEASAEASGSLGPVTATIDRLGLTALLDFSAPKKNLGIVDLTFGFKPPTGIGISIDAGSVNGSGFLFFDPDNNRYGGALELQVYSVNVKAFGVVETKLPGGQPGFSFAIVISAEFTPIQLGLGFTLNGVGGVIGINRRIDQDALATGVRTGSLEHLLFPHDVVHDAPQIIHDLEAILPATPGHYVFGPLAKIGWGTPTLIEGELGLILELPGPILALLGEVSANLPKQDKIIVALNLSVAGLLDFPKKLFSIDASLHDSRVGSFPVSGDMAMRLSWGDNPTFALAVGGFNPAFQPPPSFPVLRRVTVDLGVSGNPSLTLQGYFAITSNTAQVGALAELRASGSGIDLYGRVQFDAIIVFSPFSFEVDISAQVRISFHGHGIGVHLKGVLTGPSPWRVRGEVCVSILWWDACLSFDKSFGSAQTVELPSLDPWTGTDPVNNLKEVTGLQDALEDVRNWTPEPPPGAVAVVSLSDNSGNNQLIDPLGVAVVKQSVCPFNLQLQRFGSAKATGPANFVLATATINQVPIVPTTITFIKEPFAKAQFVELSDTQKLSAPSFEPFDGAIRLPANENAIVPGSLATTDVGYKTKVLGAPEFDVNLHFLPSNHLQGMALRSATGLAGLRRSAAQAYLDPTALPRFTFGGEEFVIGDQTTFRPVTGILTAPANKFQAMNALSAHLVDNPADGETLQVFPKFEMAGR